MALDEDPDAVDGVDAIVPITAPGQAPRDFAFGDDADTGTDVDPTTDSTTRIGTTGMGGSLVGDRPAFTSSSAAADRNALLDDTMVRNSAIDDDDRGHVVGHDRLADVVATFGSTLDSIRASQGHAPRHNLPTGSSTNQKRIAQVVQATPIGATQVVELLRAGRATAELLVLDTDTPAVGRGDVVFPGKLRMPGGTRRRVDLRVYPTASGNLTVLELLPRRSWMPQTRRYLRAGVPAITALSDAIEAVASSAT